MTLWDCRCIHCTVARRLVFHKEPSHVTQASGRLHTSSGLRSLCHRSSYPLSVSFCTFTKWISSTFHPKERVQVVVVQTFMSFCSFPSFHTCSAQCEKVSLGTVVVLLEQLCSTHAHTLPLPAPRVFSNHVQNHVWWQWGSWGGSTMCLRK